MPDYLSKLANEDLFNFFKERRNQHDNEQDLLLLNNKNDSLRNINNLWINCMKRKCV